MEGSLIGEVEAGLVAVHEAEGMFPGEILECRRHAIQPVTGFLGRDLLLEHAGFEGPGAAQAPVRRDHFLNHAEFHAIGGSKAFQVLLQEGIESFGRFILQEGAAGEQAMSDSVLRRPQLPCLGDRTPGTGAVGPGRLNSSER